MRTTKDRERILPAQVRDELAELQALLDLADQAHPDSQVMERLRRVYDHVPALWQWVGNMTTHIQREITKTLSGGPGSQEAITRYAHSMRDGLGYADAPAIERALIDHVVTCWLRLCKAECVYTRCMNEPLPSRRSTYCEHHLTATQARYLRACEALARVRRLRRSDGQPVQVNIAGQQINVVSQQSAAALDKESAHISRLP